MKLKNPLPLVYASALAAIVLLGLFRGQVEDEARIRIGVTFQNLQNEFVITIQDAMRETARAYRRVAKGKRKHRAGTRLERPFR